MLACRPRAVSALRRHGTGDDLSDGILRRRLIFPKPRLHGGSGVGS
jgi:hypothetical protein